MTGACPGINRLCFVWIFLTGILLRLRRVFLVGVSAGSVVGALTSAWGKIAPIISEVRGEFVLFIEASKQSFEGWGHSPPFVGCGWGGGGGITYNDGVGGTHLRGIYYLVPYIDLGDRWVFRYLASLLLFLKFNAFISINHNFDNCS